MWLVKNNSPFATASAWLMNVEGRQVWTVAVKASYDIGPRGELVVSETQSEARLVPQMRSVERAEGLPSISVVDFESDLMPFRTQTDITLTATAFAPAGPTVSSFKVSVNVVAKRGQGARLAAADLLVLGERTWDLRRHQLIPTKPKPVRKVALCWENAFGGWDVPFDKSEASSFHAGNPAGRGFYREQVSVPESDRLPSIVSIEAPDAFESVGFAPRASFWDGRREAAGDLEAWQTEHRPLVMPDVHPDFYLAGSPLLRTGQFLQGDELVVLRNLAPNGQVRFVVPLSPVVLTTWLDNASFETEPRLTGMWVQPDAGRVELTWCIGVPVMSRLVEALEGTVVDLREGDS